SIPPLPPTPVVVVLVVLGSPPAPPAPPNAPPPSPLASGEVPSPHPQRATSKTTERRIIPHSLPRTRRRGAADRRSGPAGASSGLSFASGRSFGVRRAYTGRTMAGAVKHQRGDLIAGKYAIFRELSGSEDSTTFAAENRSVGRPCAVEIFHPDRIESAEGFLEHLRRIGRIGSHPSVVEVFDTGIDEAHGAPFIAMELLEGETLREHVAHHSPLAARE